MEEKEIVSAIRLKDNKVIKVYHISSIYWKDIETNDMLLLHIDIEILY